MKLNRLSQIFQPISVVPKTAQIRNQNVPTSKSQKLMLDLGILRQASPGCFHFLPLGVKSLEKLIRLVDGEMAKIGGQKVKFPTMTNAKLWKTTGRFDTMSSELFKFQDRHGQSYILSPTHEEAVSDLIASLGPLSYKNYPLKMYQITSKFRDEIKPRFGLMRAKQFLMKDMYSFDVDMESAKKSYEDVCNCYDAIFSKIGVNFVRVLGSTGDMGGLISHEYHYQADIGEDRILTCAKCQYSANVEVLEQEACPKCNEKNGVQIKSAIEVGHTFLLGDKYSKPLNAHFLDKNQKLRNLQMGCYGLGLSRILAASIEVQSTEEEMRWPMALAPYTVCIIPPKTGSKEELHLKNSNLLENLYAELETSCHLKNDVLVDDRLSMTIGKRYVDARRVGYPFIVALGRKCTEEPALYELTILNESSNNDSNSSIKQMFLNKNELLDCIKKAVVSQNKLDKF